MSKKSHHFLMLWPWLLTYDLEKLIRSGHYHYQCVYQIWEQSIPWFLSYRVNTIAGGGRLRRKTITSPDPSDTGDINIYTCIDTYTYIFYDIIHTLIIWLSRHFFSIILKDASEHIGLISALRILFHMIGPWYLIPVLVKFDTHKGMCKCWALLVLCSWIV